MLKSAVVLAVAAISTMVVGAAPAQAITNTWIHAPKGGGQAMSTSDGQILWCDTKVDGLTVRAYIASTSTGQVRLVGPMALSGGCSGAGGGNLDGRLFDYFTVCTSHANVIVSCHAWTYRF